MPNIIDVAYNFGPLSKRSITNYIALHHSESKVATPQMIHEWHRNNGWSGIGYHFVVRKNGYIYRGRPLDTIGAHVSGMNSVSIGICAEGSYMIEEMPFAQKKAICELLVYLKGIYPNAKIVGHREIGDSDCPGDNYPLADIRANYEYYAGVDSVNNEEEDIDMSKADEIMAAVKALGDKIESVEKEVQNLSSEMVYNYIDKNMPPWARPIIAALREVEVITGVNDEGDLALKYQDLRQIAMAYRGGAYDEKLQVKRDDKGKIISSPIVEKYDGICEDE